MNENKKKIGVPAGYLIDERGKLYVLDVYKDEKVFLEKPNLFIPEKKKARGRKPEKLKAEERPCSLIRWICLAYNV